MDSVKSPNPSFCEGEAYAFGSDFLKSNKSIHSIIVDIQKCDGHKKKSWKVKCAIQNSLKKGIGEIICKSKLIKLGWKVTKKIQKVEIYYTLHVWDLKESDPSTQAHHQTSLFQ